MTVVGIVGDVAHNALTAPISGKFYVPHTQFHRQTGSALSTMTLTIRTGGDPLAMVDAIRAEVRRLDPNLPISDVRLMTQVVADSIGTTRFTGMVLVSFAVFALALAALGTYGLLAYFVSARAKEIGIRMAVGASRAQVMSYVLTRGARLILTGGAAGIVAALVATRLMTTLLHEVSPLDPLTFALAPAVLAGVGLVACAVPALRASRIDPTTAMRGN
jgi:ABC-type antimicrobial peptide transport system permease subunit